MPIERGAARVKAIEKFEELLRTSANEKLNKFYRERLAELSTPGYQMPTKQYAAGEWSGKHYEGPDHREETMPWLLDAKATRLFHTKHQLTPSQFFDGSRDHGPVHMARENCASCAGYGLRGKSGRYCHCVYRAIAVEMMRKLREVEAQTPGQTTMHMGENGPYVQMKMSNFVVDVELATRAIFGRAQKLIWKLYFEERMDWRATIEQLNKQLRPDQPWTRGSFFHELYVMMVSLGQISLDRGLFPSGWYFTEKRLTKQMIGDSSGSGSTWRKSPWLNGGYYEDFVAQTARQEKLREKNPKNDE